MSKKVFVIWWWVDASNYKNYEDYLNKLEFNPYEIDEKRWKDNLWEDLWEWFEVIRIPMPNKRFAEYKYWKIMFEKALKYFSDFDILVWHSNWAIFLLKYLNENKFEKDIFAIHLIAPASQNTPNEKLWSFKFDKKLESFRKYENITNFYFSEDDEVVPFKQCLDLQKILKDSKYNIFQDKWHFRMQHFEELVENIKK